MEHQRQRTAGRNAQRTFRKLTGKDLRAVLQCRELDSIRRIRLRPEHPPECEHEILCRDGILGGVSLSRNVGQAVLQIKGISAAVCRLLPPLAEGWFDLAGRVFPDQPAVEIFTSDDVRRCGSDLRIKVRGDGVHEPCKAVGTRTAPGQGQKNHDHQRSCGHAKWMFQKNALLAEMRFKTSIPESVEKDNYLFVNFDDLSVQFCGLCGLGVAYCAEKV